MERRQGQKKDGRQKNDKNDAFKGYPPSSSGIFLLDE
jgi:hypothetical protein